MTFRLVTVALAGAALAAACGGPEPESTTPPPPAAAPAEPASSAADQAIPDVIFVERGGFTPEGIEYDPVNRRFLVGSMAEGTVFIVGTDGTLTPLTDDPDLVTSVGIRVDADRNRLLVANSQLGQGAGQAKLGVFNLDDGSRIAMVDLGAAIVDPPEDIGFFANDVAVGDDGSAYVTDSRARVLYRVDTEYNASVLMGSEPVADRDPFMWNGIVFHQDGYLLVADAQGGRIFKVPVDAPDDVSEVVLPEPINGADGMVWHPDGRLVVVSASQERVVSLRSGDDWASAEFAGIAAYDGQATTAAVVGNEIYVVHPHFRDPEALPRIERMTFR